MYRTLFKYLLVLSLIISVLSISQRKPETWYVYYHRGRILLHDKTLLKDDTDIPVNEQLIYTSSTDKIYVLISHVGEVELHASDKARKQGSNLLELLSEAAHFKVKHGSLVNQGPGNLLAYDLLPEHDFSNKILLRKANHYLFDQTTYPNSSGFFLKSNSSNEKNMPIDLVTNADTLILRADDFISNRVGLSYTIGYSTATTSKVVAIINPIVDTNGETETIILNLLKGTRNVKLSRDTLRQRCYFDVYNILGRPSLIDFDRTFDTLFHQIHTNNQ